MRNKKSDIDVKKTESMQCVLLPTSGKWCFSKYKSYYKKTYQLWRSVCQEGLISVGLKTKAFDLCSDSFIHQDEVVSLFVDNMAIGLFVFSWLDLTITAECEQHYFQDNYPKPVLEELIQKYPFLMTMGHLMVHPDWRKQKIGTCVSEILVDLAVMRFLESPAKGLLTITRNHRKTNDLGYRHGARPLLQKHQWYGDEADIIIVDRGSARLTNIPGIAKQSERLWRNKNMASLYQSYPENIFVD